jgi:hypothetical protein
MTMRAHLLALTSLAAMLLSGCVSPRYQLARHDTPPAQAIDHRFPPAAELEAHLVGLITYHGPGSWKREALWDEYVVTLHNTSAHPITVESAALTDSAGRVVVPGSDPWALEKQSKALETQYRSSGEAFVRAAAPGVLLVGTSAAAAAATASGWALVSPAAAGAMLATVFVVPVYYTTVVAIDFHNKHQILAEFERRRLAAPVTLTPGETRTASLFFPMVRSPTALDLNWRSDSGPAQAALPLEFLNGLHVPAVRTAGSPRAGQ